MTISANFEISTFGEEEKNATLQFFLSQQQCEAMFLCEHVCFQMVRVLPPYQYFQFCFFFDDLFFPPKAKSQVALSKSHRKMMFTKVGLRLASAALPGVRAGVGVPERRLCSRALPVSAAARLVRVEPRHWAGMVVRG